MIRLPSMTINGFKVNLSIQRFRLKLNDHPPVVLNICIHAVGSGVIVKIVIVINAIPRTLNLTIAALSEDVRSVAKCDPWP